MKIVMLSFVLLAVLMTCRAVPAPPPPFTDEKADRESLDVNEVGPAEDWMLLNRLTKTRSYDPSDSEKTRVLLKEIEEFSRLANNFTTTDEPEDTTDQQDTTEADSASSDWFASTWRTLNRNDDGDDDDSNAIDFRRPFGKQERQDDTGVEEIIKKISNDLKKLYVKIKQAITVMKNWVNSARGSSKEFDGPYPMSASASESDGVFVIADPLIGDIDKSNKYTLPINAED